MSTTILAVELVNLSIPIAFRGYDDARSFIANICFKGDRSRSLLSMSSLFQGRSDGREFYKITVMGVCTGVNHNSSWEEIIGTIKQKIAIASILEDDNTLIDINKKSSVLMTIRKNFRYIENGL